MPIYIGITFAAATEIRLENKSYLTEGEPFEMRCASARQFLAVNWAEICVSANKTSEALAAMRERTEALMTKYPKPAVIELLAQSAKTDEALIIGSTERLVALSWTHALKMAASMYGDDATEFARHALSRERAAN